METFEDVRKVLVLNNRVLGFKKSGWGNKLQLWTDIADFGHNNYFQQTAAHF